MVLPNGIVFVDSMELFKTWLSGNDYHINEITRIAEKGTLKINLVIIVKSFLIKKL